MNNSAAPLRSVHRKAYALGLAMCLGSPALVAGLLLGGLVPPGDQAPEGTVLQVGYLFTGLVFLSAAWVWWRRGRALRAFQEGPEAQRAPLMLRETLLYSAAFEISSLCGLVYWILVGTHATRHVWGFIVLTPLLFAALVPRFEWWVKAP